MIEINRKRTGKGQENMRNVTGKSLRKDKENIGNKQENICAYIGKCLEINKQKKICTYIGKCLEINRKRYVRI